MSLTKAEIEARLPEARSKVLTLYPEQTACGGDAARAVELFEEFLLLKFDDDESIDEDDLSTAIEEARFDLESELGGLRSGCSHIPETVSELMGDELLRLHEDAEEEPDLVRGLRHIPYKAIFEASQVMAELLILEYRIARRHPETPSGVRKRLNRQRRSLARQLVVEVEFIFRYQDEIFHLLTGNCPTELWSRLHSVRIRPGNLPDCLEAMDSLLQALAWHDPAQAVAELWIDAERRVVDYDSSKKTRVCVGSEGGTGDIEEDD